MSERRRWRPSVLLVDGLLAAALLAVMVVGTHYVGQVPPRRAPDAIAYALMAVISVAMVARRLEPVPVLTTTIASTCVYLLLQFPYGPILFAAGLALYTAGRHLPARRALLVCSLAVAAVIGVQLVGSPPSQLLQQAGHIASWQSWLLLPWAPLGAALRVRREVLDRDRKDEVARLAFEERLRIAREVHDIVGHSMAVINMQAGVALRVLDRRPEKTRDALEAIKQTSKDSLDELRGTLAVFRQRDEAANRQPIPGLGQLDGVAAAMEQSGLPVRVSVAGERRDVPTMVDQAAYRIVQESLTNALRHAGPTTATVSVSYERGELVVEVVDGGRARPGSPVQSGNGLAGMRERVAAVGGMLEAGPRPTGGFRVRATLPTATGTT